MHEILILQFNGVFFLYALCITYILKYEGKETNEDFIYNVYNADYSSWQI
jgi:hypothetical protein